MSAALNDVKVEIARAVLKKELRDARARGVEIPSPEEDFTDALDKLAALVRADEKMDPRVWIVVLKTVAFMLET